MVCPSCHRENRLSIAPNLLCSDCYSTSRTSIASTYIVKAGRNAGQRRPITEAYAVSRRERKRVEMLFAHLKRILKLDRLRLRGPNGAKDEFLLAATAQNLRKLAKLIPLPPPIFAA